MRVVFTIALLVFCGSTAVAADTERLRIISSRESNSIGVGQRVTFTWTVVGTTRPVQLQLAITNSAVATMDGGNKRIVTTSGGDPNSVSVVAIGRQQGAFNVIAELVDPSDREKLETTSDSRPKPRDPNVHAGIATAFASTLRQVSDEIDRAAQRIPVRGDERVRVDDVLVILDRAERTVRNGLPQPEMAAFRDAVAEFLDRVRCHAVTEASLARLDSGIVLVARRNEIPESTARSLLARVSDFFSNAAGREPLIEICIETTPLNNATVTLSPKSIDREQSVTSMSLMTVYVGLYRYRVQREGVESRGEVNLTVTPRRLIVLPLHQDEDSPTAPQYKELTQACQ